MNEEANKDGAQSAREKLSLLIIHDNTPFIAASIATQARALVWYVLPRHEVMQLWMTNWK